MARSRKPVCAIRGSIYLRRRGEGGQLSSRAGERGREQGRYCREGDSDYHYRRVNLYFRSSGGLAPPGRWHAAARDTGRCGGRSGQRLSPHPQHCQSDHRLRPRRQLPPHLRLRPLHGVQLRYHRGAGRLALHDRRRHAHRDQVDAGGRAATHHQHAGEARAALEQRTVLTADAGRRPPHRPRLHQLRPSATATPTPPCTGSRRMAGRCDRGGRPASTSASSWCPQHRCRP